MELLIVGDYVYRRASYYPTRRKHKRIPIARINGPYGLLLEKDTKGNYYLDGEKIDRGKGSALQWSARWVYRGEELVEMGKDG